MVQRDDERMIRTSENLLQPCDGDTASALLIKKRESRRGGKGGGDCTSSAKARLILFRLIISFLLRTFIAYSLCVCFSLTRYTLPTSPLPSMRTFWKLEGPTSRSRTLIELDE